MARMIEIEKGIPAPTSLGKYPWDTMEVGDSFFIEGANHQTGIHSCARNKGFKIRAKLEGNGLRVWLIGKVPARKR